MLTVLAPVVVFTGCPSSRQGSDLSLDAQLQDALDGSLRSSGATGVSAALVMPDGSLWRGVSGVSHEGVPLTTDMLFDIASAAKNLQAALALTLVEDSLISLDDPLEKWLPPYPNVNGKITIRQLLNLTSGIDNIVEDRNSPWRIGYENIRFEHRWTWEEINATFVGRPNFNPGERCAYSSTNYILLRLVIEKATRSDQSTELAGRLLGPQRLKHTVADFRNPVPDSLRIAHAWYDSDGDGRPADISGNPLTWLATLSPMLVYSTPSDMATWIDALYHRKTVLGEESLKEMLAFGGPVQNEPLMKAYGLGVVDLNLGMLNPHWEKVRAYGHLGSQFGYSTFVAYFPEYGVSMAMMFNRGADRATEPAIVPVFAAFTDVLFRHLGATESEGKNDVATMLDQLKKSPDDIHLLDRIAKAHQANKDDYEASLVYEEILRRDPNDAYGYRTEALFWKASYDGVIWKKPEHLIAFIAEHKDYKDIKRAYTFLAKTYTRRGEMDQAIQVYRNALAAVGKDADFYNEYAWWVYENRLAAEYDAALRYAAAAVELKPGAYYIWDTLAWLYHEKGAHDRAIEASSTALKLAPVNQRAEYERSLEKITRARPGSD